MRSGVRTRVAFGFRIALGTMMLSAIAPKPAEAGLWCWLFGDGCGSGGTTTHESSPERAAPEIDWGVLAGAIALAAGGAAMLSDRVRRRE